MMAHHQHHLFDFSSPPNAAAIISMPSSFDHAAGLLSLHDVAAADHHIRGGGGLASPWSQQQVSLSLYKNAAGAGSPPSSSLVVHQQLAAFAAAPAQPFQLRGSKYLGPVKALLAEFCSLEVEGDLSHAMDCNQQRAPKIGKWDDMEGSGSWGNLSLSSMDLLDLERRKARIFSMVEEVDRRYRRYREQMRAVEVSFEAVAGGGAAQVYTKLAMRAMSRHFRCLRDALVGQVRALRKAMGERDAGGGVAAAAAPGATKGDTPRLRVLDQCLRQQRAFQQSGAVDNFPWRPQRGLPERAVAVLRAWLFEHFLHPYPNDVDKHILARQTGLSRSQVSNWFINARVRLWKPMIEDMYKEETKPESSDNNIGSRSNNNKLNPSGGNKQQHRDDNRNYTGTAAASLVGQSSSSSSSYHLHLRSSGNPNSSLIPAASTSIDHRHDGSHQLFGHMYSSAAGLHHGGAVSLTLGLQQQQPFAAAASMMHHQQPFMVEAAAEEEEDDVLPYRNLMESQLLHDFAG